MPQLFIFLRIFSRRSYDSWINMISENLAHGWTQRVKANRVNLGDWSLVGFCCILGPVLINILISDLGSGLKGILSKFVEELFIPSKTERLYRESFTNLSAEQPPTL